MKNIAVIFTYSFDDEVAIYLFNTLDEATHFIESSYDEEVRIDTEENEWDTEYYISDDKTYAKIVNHFYDRDDITEFRIGNVYQ